MKIYATVEGMKMRDDKYIKTVKNLGSDKQINIFISIDNEERFKLFITKQDDGTITFRCTDNTMPYPKNMMLDKTIEEDKEWGEDNTDIEHTY